jgi:hypothetical protein
MNRLGFKYGASCFMLRFRKIDTTMTLSTSSRFIATCFTLISLLFMQLAVAAYVCPAMQPVSAQTSFGAALKTPCHQLDLEQPTLCRVHASDIGSKLSLDKPDLPHVHAFVPVRMAQTIESVPFAGHAINQPVRYRATHFYPPPSVILHCCFQI